MGIIRKVITKAKEATVDTAVKIMDATNTYEPITNIISEVIESAQDNGLITKISDEDLLARQKICYTCPHMEFFNGYSPIEIKSDADYPDMNSFSGRCGLCKCSYSSKLRLKNESCPIGKWKSLK